MSGYAGDLFDDQAERCVVDPEGAVLEPIRAACRAGQMAAVVGAPVREGDALLLSSLVIDRTGATCARYAKRCLDGDERAWFVPGEEALAVLSRAGSRSALVNLGGSIGVLGAPPWNAEGWPVGIADPRNPGEVLKEIPLAKGHLATSGTYERSVSTPEGEKHHLLDPVTGEPTEGVDAVTVWCARGVEADLQSTVEFLATARKRAGLDVAEPPLFLRRIVSLT